MKTELLQSTSSQVCRVLVADDHPVVRQGLGEFIRREADLDVVGEAMSASEVLDLVEQVKPDVVVTDLSFEGFDGIELIKDLRARHARLAVLVLSMHDESFYAQRVLKAGAMGYLMKQEPVARVIEGIRAVHRGRICLSEKMSQAMLSQMAGVSVHAHHRDGHYGAETLTDRELEVLRLIGQGRSTREIAQTLHLSIKTIETHRENIKQKLSLENASQLVRYAVRFALDGS